MTFSFSRIQSGIHTVESCGSDSLGLSILTIEPKYGQSPGWIVRALLPGVLVPGQHP